MNNINWIEITTNTVFDLNKIYVLKDKNNFICLANISENDPNDYETDEEYLKEGKYCFNNHINGNYLGIKPTHYIELPDFEKKTSSNIPKNNTPIKIQTQNANIVFKNLLGK